MTLNDQQVRNIIEALCAQATIRREWVPLKLLERTAGLASLPALTPLADRYLAVVSDRIKIGTSVRISHQTDRDRGYVVESHAGRKLGDTLTGVTIAEHDSHGLCYDVKLPSGTVITYDREELVPESDDSGVGPT